MYNPSNDSSLYPNSVSPNETQLQYYVWSKVIDLGYTPLWMKIMENCIKENSWILYFDFQNKIWFLISENRQIRSTRALRPFLLIDLRDFSCIWKSRLVSERLVPRWFWPFKIFYSSYRGCFLLWVLTLIDSCVFPIWNRLFLISVSGLRIHHDIGNISNVPVSAFKYPEIG